MKNMSERVFLAGTAALLLVGGCKNFDEYQDERTQYAVKHFE